MINLVIFNNKFELDYGINNLVIRNQVLYRKIYANFFETIVLLDGVVECSSTNCCIIKQPLDVTSNEKKNITYLFKLINKTIKDKYEDEYLKIITSLNNLLNEVSNQLDVDMEYDEVDLPKLLQSFNVQYEEENKSFIELFLSFINTLNLINHPKIFITFNLTNLLTNDEYLLLKEELLIKQIILLDIIITPYEKTNNKIIFVIDEDCCII